MAQTDNINALVAFVAQKTLESHSVLNRVRRLDWFFICSIILYAKHCAIPVWGKYWGLSVINTLSETKIYSTNPNARRGTSLPYFLHGNPPWRISRYQEMKIMTPKGFLTLGLQQLSKHAENK